jgi:hypothetical protein
MVRHFCLSPYQRRLGSGNASILLYDRDIRRSNIVHLIEDQSKWIIIAFPPTFAGEEFTPENHSPAIKHDGHGAKVDF